MLTELPQLPSTLTQIYAEGNDITTITRDSLQNAAKLYELFLKGNKIGSIENGAFENAKHIGWLDLSVRIQFFLHRYLSVPGNRRRRST